MVQRPCNTDKKVKMFMVYRPCNTDINITFKGSWYTGLAIQIQILLFKMFMVYRPCSTNNAKLFILYVNWNTEQQIRFMCLWKRCTGIQNTMSTPLYLVKIVIHSNIFTQIHQYTHILYSHLHKNWDMPNKGEYSKHSQGALLSNWCLQLSISTLSLNIC